MLKAIPAAAALATAAALLVPTVSRADDNNSVRVSYSDLNLASLTGQHTLRGRIVEARSVCAIEDSRELALASATKRCRNGAIESAQSGYEAAIASARHGTVVVGEAAALIVSRQ